jgi:hypothetical protein
MKLRGHKLAAAPAISLALALGLLGGSGNPADAAARHHTTARIAVFPRLTASRPLDPPWSRHNVPDLTFPHGLRATSPALPRQPKPADPPWSRQNVANVTFQHGRQAAVSCLRRTYCIAVGSTITYPVLNYNNPPPTSPPAETSFAAIWNGSVWKPMTMPSVPGAVSSSLSGVSCIPGYLYCAAVGSYETSSGLQPLTEIWNGSYWRVTPSASIQGSAKEALTAVSCTATGFCMAVGVAQGPGGEFLLDEEADLDHFNWRGVPGPLLFLHTPELLVDGLSCAGDSECMAVGAEDNSSFKEFTLAALWQGDDWLRLHTRTPGYGGVLRGVSCPTHSSCTAVGSYENTPGNFVPERTLAELWYGGRAWNVLATANDGKGTNGLYAISCRLVSVCAAVGEYVDSAGVQQTLAEQVTGSYWAIKGTTDLAGSLGNELDGVSCTAVTACTAVGDYQDETAAFTQGWAWNGTAWRPERNARDQASLYAVSCSAPSACTAVGIWEQYDSAESFVLAERWNGATWSVQLAPSPGSPAAELLGVSCPTANFCMAVGVEYDYFTSAAQNWAEEWDGTSWVWQSPPAPGNAGAGLSAVSCVSAAWCAAVGSDSPGTEEQDIADVWSSGGWTSSNVPSPSSLSYLNGVSCTAVAACTAVGTQSTSDGAYGIAVGLTGSTWSVEDTASPVNSGLSSVSCTPSACTAVGWYAAESPLTQQYTLAEQLTGGTWTMQPTPNPGGAVTNELSSVSCTAADACTAVGGYSPTQPEPTATLAETWNGSAWSDQPTVNQPGEPANLLNAVSCVASACQAAGAYTDADQDSYPLAESEAPGS